MLVDHYVRCEDGWQGEPPLETLDATLKIAAIDFALPVADIYQDVIPPAVQA